MQVILKQAGGDYKLTELSGLREAFFGGFEGGYNKDMADAGARQLGFKDGAALFSQMKAGTLAVDTNQNALAAADPKGMAENYQQVKPVPRQRCILSLKTRRPGAIKNVLAISSGTAMQIMISI